MIIHQSLSGKPLSIYPMTNPNPDPSAELAIRQEIQDLDDKLENAGGLNEVYRLGDKCAALQKLAYLLQSQRDEAVEALAEERKDSSQFASELCQLQDALGFPVETDNATARAMERIRDLIAAEGEFGDIKETLAKAEERIAWLITHRESLLKTIDELNQAHIDQNI